MTAVAVVGLITVALIGVQAWFAIRTIASARRLERRERQWAQRDVASQQRLNYSAVRTLQVERDQARAELARINAALLRLCPQCGPPRPASITNQDRMEAREASDRG